MRLPQLRPLTRDEVRGIDKRAIKEFGLSGLILMENAGCGASEVLDRLEICGRVVILACKGNNGGDGFVIARFLQLMGLEPQVLLYAQRDDVRGDAAVNLRVATTAGIAIETQPTQATSREHIQQADWIIDAMLGTGAVGALRSPLDEVVEMANTSRAQVVAIDVPTGMDCDTGQTAGACIRADHTITFVASKTGFANPVATALLGTVHVVGIGAPLKVLADFYSSADSLDCKSSPGSS